MQNLFDVPPEIRNTANKYYVRKPTPRELEFLYSTMDTSKAAANAVRDSAESDIPNLLDIFTFIATAPARDNKERYTFTLVTNKSQEYPIFYTATNKVIKARPMVQNKITGETFGWDDWQMGVSPMGDFMPVRKPSVRRPDRDRAARRQQKKAWKGQR